MKNRLNSGSLAWLLGLVMVAACDSGGSDSGNAELPLERIDRMALLQKDPGGPYNGVSVTGSIQNDTWLGYWHFSEQDQVIGSGDFDGDGRSKVLIRSGWGLGVLRQDDAGKWVATAMMPWNSVLPGGWRLGQADTLQTIGKVAGNREVIAIRSGWGLGFLSQTGGSLQLLAAFPWGTQLGTWKLEATDTILDAGRIEVATQDSILMRKATAVGYFRVPSWPNVSLSQVLGATEAGTALQGRRLGSFDYNGDGTLEVITQTGTTVNIVGKVAGGTLNVLGKQQVPGSVAMAGKFGPANGPALVTVDATSIRLMSATGCAAAGCQAFTKSSEATYADLSAQYPDVKWTAYANTFSPALAGDWDGDGQTDFVIQSAESLGVLSAKGSGLSLLGGMSWQSLAANFGYAYSNRVKAFCNFQGNGRSSFLLKNDVVTVNATANVQQQLQSLGMNYAATYPSLFSLADDQSPTKNAPVTASEAYAVTAALEAEYKRRYALPLDLAEATETQTHARAAFNGTDYHDALTYPTTTEAELPDRTDTSNLDQRCNLSSVESVFFRKWGAAGLSALVTDGQWDPTIGPAWHAQNPTSPSWYHTIAYEADDFWPVKARLTAHYGATEIKTIDVKNVELIKQVLMNKHEVIWAGAGPQGNQVALIYGFDQGSGEFLLKNAWGDNHSFDRVSYSSISANGTSARIVTGIRDPGAPVSPLPLAVGLWRLERLQGTTGVWAPVGHLAIERGHEKQAGEPETLRVGRYYSRLSGSDPDEVATPVTGSISGNRWSFGIQLSSGRGDFAFDLSTLLGEPGQLVGIDNQNASASVRLVRATQLRPTLPKPRSDIAALPACASAGQWYQQYLPPLSANDTLPNQGMASPYSISTFGNSYTGKDAHHVPQHMTGMGMSPDGFVYTASPWDESWSPLIMINPDGTFGGDSNHPPIGESRANCASDPRQRLAIGLGDQVVANSKYVYYLTTAQKGEPATFTTVISRRLNGAVWATSSIQGNPITANPDWNFCTQNFTIPFGPTNVTATATEPLLFYGKQLLMAASDKYLITGRRLTGEVTLMDAESMVELSKFTTPIGQTVAVAVGTDAPVAPQESLWAAYPKTKSNEAVEQHARPFACHDVETCKLPTLIKHYDVNGKDIGPTLELPSRVGGLAYRDGKLYATLPHTGQIAVYSAPFTDPPRMIGEPNALWTGAHPGLLGDGRFLHLVGDISVDAQGNIAVLDSMNQIVRMNNAGKTIQRRWGAGTSAFLTADPTTDYQVVHGGNVVYGLDTHATPTHDWAPIAYNPGTPRTALNPDFPEYYRTDQAAYTTGGTWNKRIVVLNGNKFLFSRLADTGIWQLHRMNELQRVGDPVMMFGSSFPFEAAATDEAILSQSDAFSLAPWTRRSGLYDQFKASKLPGGADCIEVLAYGHNIGCFWTWSDTQGSAGAPRKDDFKVFQIHGYLGEIEMDSEGSLWTSYGRNYGDPGTDWMLIKIPVASFNSLGNPIYDPAKVVYYPHPVPFNRPMPNNPGVMRFQYYPESDMMLISGYPVTNSAAEIDGTHYSSTVNPVTGVKDVKRGRGIGDAGTKLARYDHWSQQTPASPAAPTWVIDLPRHDAGFDNTLGYDAQDTEGPNAAGTYRMTLSWAAAGNRLVTMGIIPANEAYTTNNFTKASPQEDGLTVFDLTTGRKLGKIETGPNSITGFQYCFNDQPEDIRVFQRSNGEYIVSTIDLGGNLGLVFRGDLEY